MRHAPRGKVHLIGAGLAGSLLAIYLARFGLEVEVFEKRGDPREKDPLAGRSINLALAKRGLDALDQVNLRTAVSKHMLPMKGRMIHPLVSAEPELLPYGNRPDEVIYSIHRGKLNKLLVSAADRSKRVTFRFQHRLKSVSFRSNHIRIQGPDNVIRKRHLEGPLIGVDGAGSPVRRALERIEHFKSDVQLLDHGYKELTTHAGPRGSFQMRPDALHIWPRGDFMMIALPNTDGSFTNTLFMAKRGQDSFESIGADNIEAFFRTNFSDAVAQMPRAVIEFKQNPVGVLGTVRTPQWYHRHKAVVLGDAAHAIVPFHGQGMNCCFEDCAQFATLLDRENPSTPNDWESLFCEFQSLRIANTNAIADMALENYVEMRSKVSDPAFKLRRKLAQALERRHPSLFIPRYSLVMFHTVPYAEAKKRGLDQQDILEELTYGKTALNEIDWRHADHLVESELS